MEGITFYFLKFIMMDSFIYKEGIMISKPKES
jgi:hypothetical protein